MRRLLVLALALAGCLAAPEPEPPLEAPASGAAVPAAAWPLASSGGFSRTDVFPGTYAKDGEASVVLSSGPFAALAPEEVVLASGRDGAAIRLVLVRPDAAAAVPVIVQASPYYSFNGRLGGIADAQEDFASHYAARPLLSNFVPHGYAVALVAVRGTGGSGGCPEAMGPGERADLDQAVTWLGTQPWSTGAVGMIGLSYDGATAWEVASRGNPHLRTIVPIAGVSDLRDAFARNGTTSVSGASYGAAVYALGSTIYRPAPGPAAARPEDAACAALVEGARAGAASPASGTEDDAGWWAARDSRPGVLARYNGSVLLVHGFADPGVFPSHSLGWADGLEARGIVVKKLLGRWAHTYPDRGFDGDFNANPAPRWDWAEILLHWFDHWLKGRPGVDLGPRAQVADTDGRWRGEDAWPPPDAREVVLQAGADGALVSSGARAGSVPVGPDPALHRRAAEPGLACPSCATFATAPLAEELRFAGFPRAHLTVTPTAPGGQVTAELLAQLPDGTLRRLTSGQMDLRYAGGDGPAAVAPGEALLAPLELEPVDAVVPAGARLVLRVHAGAHGSDETFAKLPLPPAPFTVETGGGLSVLRLRVFERAPAAFFAPP